jgi:hypothetical protein
MNLPVVRGRIERRVLVNYRIDPDVVAKQLPAPFRPLLGPSGYAIAGICLIRLADIRPVPIPAAFGVRSENAAHRIAVAWDDPTGVRQGVYIPRRDSSSRVNTLVGGRLFPGVHHRARFDVLESDGHFRIELESLDRTVHVLVDGTVADRLPAQSMFCSLAEASAFFERGSLGYSATPRPGRFDGLELRSFAWHVEPLDVAAIASSYFENERLFPRGLVEFDCALLMRDIAHEWHARDQLCDASAA